jgi:hypothetical protein
MTEQLQALNDRPPISQPDAPPRLFGRSLKLARLVWIVMAGLMLAVFAAAVPARFSQLLTVTPLGDNALTILSTNEAVALEQRGIPIMLHALYFILLEMGFAATYAGFGLTLFLRKNDEPLAMFASLALVAVGVLIPGTVRALDSPASGMEFIIHLVQVLGWISFFTSFHVFPDGRFIPAWTRFLVVLFVLWGIAWILFPFANAFNWPLPLALLAFAAASSIGVAAQIYRYVRVSNSFERQQTKWVLFGFAGATVGTMVFAVPAIIFPVLNSPGLPRVVYYIVGVGFFASSLLLIPATIETAVRRYRLWAIDPLINRVVVYTLLTVGLALFYGGSVLVLQRILRVLTGAGDNLAIVLSTLAIAALFNPVRLRIQDGIDRRFNRRKYDAQQVLARFGATARDEVELDKLTGELLSVVSETMQPASVSLSMLKPPIEDRAG